MPVTGIRGSSAQDCGARTPCLQNREGQTIASGYSMRPKPGATVSPPMKWSAMKLGLDPKALTLETVPPCMKKQGDLFKDALLKTPFDLVAANAALDLLLE